MPRSQDKPQRGDAVRVFRPYRNEFGIVAGSCSMGLLIEFPDAKDAEWISSGEARILYCHHCGMRRAEHSNTGRCLYDVTTFCPERGV